MKWDIKLGRNNTVKLATFKLCGIMIMRIVVFWLFSKNVSFWRENGKICTSER